LQEEEEEEEEERGMEGAVSAATDFSPAIKSEPRPFPSPLRQGEDGKEGGKEGGREGPPASSTPSTLLEDYFASSPSQGPRAARHRSVSSSWFPRDQCEEGGREGGRDMGRGSRGLTRLSSFSCSILPLPPFPF